MWRIAWRNLWRNRTRTIVSVSAIALTYAMFLFSIGMAEAMYGQLEESASKLAGGTVLVHAKGYWDSQTNEFVVDDSASLIRVLSSVDGVDGLAPRVILEGLLSTSSGNAGVRLMGIVPEAERPFQDYAEYIRDGAYFGEVDPDLQGAPLVLGSKIVDDLEVGLGDRIVLTTTDASGEMRRALFHLHGVLHTGMSSMDRGLAFTTISGAQEALGAEVLTQIGVISEKPEIKDAMIRATSAAGIIPLESLEFLTWQEAMPDLIGMIELDKQFGNLYGVIIFIVVVFAIMNTFLMVVLERIREFGLLGALGLTPRQIAQLVLTESTLLALVAMTIGFVLGLIGHLLMQQYGLDIRALYGDFDMGGVAIADPIIRSKISVSRWTNATIMIFVLVILSSLYPALKAARLRPAESMRFYQ